MLIALVLTISVGQSWATDNHLNPTPQQMNFVGKVKKPTELKVKSQSIDAMSIVGSKLAKKANYKHKMTLIVGNKNYKPAKKYAHKVPNKKEAYYINIDKNNIYVVGADNRGTYYGLRTLEQLLEKEELPMGEITDFPDLASRGVVEGFYGTPWSHEKRLRQIEFYGKFKLNTYIYGPKDDPYHSSPNWRKPYPEREAEQIKSLVNKSKENFVDFVWAIHPGKDIKWNEEDRVNLINKFEKMYELGVKAFAVFFDDISGDGTNPVKQAELLNYIHDNFVAKKHDVNPLIMCPTEYNRSWSNPKKKYLETLGENLYPSIEIMWTGNYVIADIDKETMEWINSRIKRKAYIWWNFPVSDYVRDRMLLGAAYGNSNDVKNDMSGFVSNPMEHPEASKIAIYGVADYTWNVEKYDSDLAWRKGIKEVMPHNHDALLIFAKHNSDLGANGHRYRRVESAEFKPIAEDFVNQLSKGAKNSQTERVLQEFKQMCWAAEKLSSSNESPLFIEEIKPWIVQFDLVGKTGQEIIALYNIINSGNLSTFKAKYDKVLHLQKTMFETDQKYNQNPFQPGVKTATLIIEPMMNKTLKYAVSEYNKTTGEDLKLQLNFNPNKLNTNIKQLESQPLHQKAKSLRISPALEYINVKTNNYIGIEFEEIVSIKQLNINLETDQTLNRGKVIVSSDGENWNEVSGLEMKNKRLQLTSPIQNIKYIRYVVTHNEAFDIKLNQFEVTRQ